MDNSLTYFESDNADHNIFVRNTLTGANMGMWIGAYGKNCSYNLFAFNRIERAGLWGILMGAGSYNVFFGNIISNTGVGIGHDGYGLALGGTHLVAENNLFLHNSFINNTKNFGANWPVTGANSFDDGKEGNYWDDYFQKAGNGNSPYILGDNNVDNHPLIKQPILPEKMPTLPEPWASLLAVQSISELPSQSPTPSQTANTSPIDSSPSPTIPELSWLTILPILLTTTIALAIVRKRLQRNV